MSNNISNNKQWWLTEGPLEQAAKEEPIKYLEHRNLGLKKIKKEYKSPVVGK